MLPRATLNHGEQKLVYRYLGFLVAQGDSTEACSPLSVRRSPVELSPSCRSSNPPINAPVLASFPFLSYFPTTSPVVTSQLNHIPMISHLRVCFRESLNGDIPFSSSHSQKKQKRVLSILPHISHPQYLLGIWNNGYFWETVSPLNACDPVLTQDVSSLRIQLQKSGLRNTRYAVNFTCSIIRSRCCWPGHNCQTVVTNMDTPAALPDGSVDDLQGELPLGVHMAGCSVYPP